MIIIVIASDQMRGEAIDRHELCIVDRITVEGGCQNPAEQCHEEQKCAHARIETKIHCCAAERHMENGSDFNTREEESRLTRMPKQCHQ